MTRPGLTSERLTALFILGVLLFTPPFVGIFNTPLRVLGIPALYLYLFVAWGLLVALVAFVAERAGGSAEGAGEGAQAGPTAADDPLGE